MNWLGLLKGADLAIKFATLGLLCAVLIGQAFLGVQRAEYHAQEMRTLEKISSLLADARANQ